MEQFQINSSEDFKRLIDIKKEQTTKIASTLASAEAIKISQEVAEREFDLFEFSLFISSFGKEKLDKSTERVRELRARIDKGQVDLSIYEQMLE